MALQKQYASYTNANELLTIPEALEAVTIRTVSLLTTDVTAHSLLGVSSEMMEAEIRGLHIQMKMFSKHSKVIWDVLLASEVEANILGGSFLFAKSVQLVS